MAGWDWTPYVTGGAARPDSFSGMDPRFSFALQQMFAAAPPEIQAQLRVSSGYRSPERQAELWQGALAKYGSPDAARKWVAPPGRSNHNHGYAADLKYLSPVAQQWAHQNAGQFGLAFPLSNENWHVELAGARGAGGSATAGMPQQSAPSIDQLAPAAMAIDTGAGSMNPVGNLADMFRQTQEARQRQRDEEQAAADARRVALLSGGLAGLYGA